MNESASKSKGSFILSQSRASISSSQNCPGGFPHLQNKHYSSIYNPSCLMISEHIPIHASRAYWMEIHIEEHPRCLCKIFQVVHHGVRIWVPDFIRKGIQPGLVNLWTRHAWVTAWYSCMWGQYSIQQYYTPGPSIQSYMARHTDGWCEQIHVLVRCTYFHTDHPQGTCNCCRRMWHVSHQVQLESHTSSHQQCMCWNNFRHKFLMESMVEKG